MLSNPTRKNPIYKIYDLTRPDPFGRVSGRVPVRVKALIAHPNCYVVKGRCCVTVNANVPYVLKNGRCCVIHKIKCSYVLNSLTLKGNN